MTSRSDEMIDYRNEVSGLEGEVDWIDEMVLVLEIYRLVQMSNSL